MAVGVSMARACPDQSKYEAQRRASIAADLYEPPAPAKVPKSPVKAASVADKLRADEARRIAGGFTRGGHR